MDQNFGTACSRSVYIKEADKCALGLVIELVKYGKWGADMGQTINPTEDKVPDSYKFKVV